MWLQNEAHVQNTDMYYKMFQMCFLLFWCCMYSWMATADIELTPRQVWHSRTVRNRVASIIIFLGFSFLYTKKNCTFSLQEILFPPIKRLETVNYLDAVFCITKKWSWGSYWIAQTTQSKKKKNSVVFFYKLLYQRYVYSWLYPMIDEAMSCRCSCRQTSSPLYFYST